MKKKKILFIASEPTGVPKTHCDKDLKQISALKMSEGFGDKFEIIPWPALKADEIVEILDFSPDYVHYCGHGNRWGEIQTEKKRNQVISFDTEIFRDYLGRYKKAECVILCSCFSKKLADKLMDSAEYTIAFEGKVSNENMHVFTNEFYKQLFKVGSPLHAYLKVTDKMKSICQQEVHLVFKSKLTYVMESKLLQLKNELSLEKADLDRFKADIKFAEMMLERLTSDKAKGEEKNFSLFQKLIKTHPTPNEVIWFATVKDMLAENIAKEVLLGKSDKEINKLFFELRMLFLVFEGILVAYDSKELTKDNFRKLTQSFDADIYINAFDRLQHVKFECGKSRNFEDLFQLSLDYAKSMILNHD